MVTPTQAYAGEDTSLAMRGRVYAKARAKNPGRCAKSG
jgi:hypothetical protein